MRDEEPENLAEELEHVADEMERRSQRLEKETEAARADWQSKRSDPKVPGAPAPSGEDEPPPEAGPSGQGS